MKNIVVHKTLKRAQNKNQHSADNCAGQSYPLNAMSFFITFMSFMVKKRFCTRGVQNEARGCPKWEKPAAAAVESEKSEKSEKS